MTVSYCDCYLRRTSTTVSQRSPPLLELAILQKDEARMAVPKSTQIKKIYRDNHIRYSYLIFVAFHAPLSLIWTQPTTIVIHSTDSCIQCVAIATQKPSIGMNSDVPTFWHYHPYFILQSYYTCYCFFFLLPSGQFNNTTMACCLPIQPELHIHLSLSSRSYTFVSCAVYV